MSSALLAGLFAILGMGLAGTSAACWMLWRRVRELTSASTTVGAPGVPDSSATVSVVLPKGPAKSRTDDWTRRFDDLLGKYRALEDRVAKLEASATTSTASVRRRPVASRPARRIDPGSSATSSGPTLILVPDLAAPPASNSEAAAELDRRFGPVWAMADEGTPIDAIARETGYPIGQVELILGLRRRLLVAEAEAGSDA